MSKKRSSQGGAKKRSRAGAASMTPTPSPSGMDHRKIGMALGRIPSGIFVVTARHNDQETGMLASWVQQASFNPPMVTIAVKKGRYLADWLAQGVLFVINILSDDEKMMLAHFGKGFGPDEPAFEELAIRHTARGIPVLREALAYLECRGVGELEGGDHRIFLGEVLDGGIQTKGQPMIHVRNNGFHY